VGLLLTEEVSEGDPLSGVRGGVVDTDETDSAEYEVLLEVLEELEEDVEERRDTGIGTAEVVRGLEGG